MGYLNNQLEKVASAVIDGMEKKASKLLSVLGKVGRGIKSAPGRALSHIAKHPGNYALGAGLAGLAGWGAYNYANTGKIDPETGMPVLARDRAFIGDGLYTLDDDKPNHFNAEEYRAYARAAEDYKNKRGYYKNMPWYHKILPFSVGDELQTHLEFYRHSGHLMPRVVNSRGGVYIDDERPYDSMANDYIRHMSDEEKAALDAPEVEAAVQASLDTQRPTTRANSPWRHERGFNSVGDYYRDMFPYTRRRYSEELKKNYDYDPSKYGVTR